MYAALGIQALLKELGFDASILGGDMLAFAVARSGRKASLQGFGNSSDGYAHYWVTAEGRLIDLGLHYLPLDSRYLTEPMPLVAWPLEEGLPVFLRYRVGEDFGPKTALAADLVIEQRMEDFLHLCRRKLAGQVGQPTLPHWVLQDDDGPAVLSSPPGHTAKRRAFSSRHSVSLVWREKSGRHHMKVDFEKMDAELTVLRGFIDFVNKQSGVYMDCLAGFQGNIARIERQKAHVLRPERKTLENGAPNVMYNAERGFNHEQVRWSIITFIFAYWDEEIRPQIARIRGADVQAVIVEAMGDLRLLRNAVIHNKGILTASDHAKMTKLKGLVHPDERVTLSYDDMHGLFAQVKKAIGALVMTYTSQLPGAPNPADVVEVAIQNVRSSGPVKRPDPPAISRSNGDA